MNNEMSEEDFVLYRDKKDNKLTNSTLKEIIKDI